MAIVLGLDAKLFRGAAGSQASTEVTNVKDLTLNLESGEADVTTRATKGWKAYVATLKEASLEFSILYDPDDADFTAFQTAYFSNTPMALFISDGQDTAHGLDADFSDIMNRYNKGQYLVLLMNTTMENCEIIQKRINQKFMVNRQRISVRYYVSALW